MFSKIWLINLLLSAVVVFAGFQAYRTWQDSGKKEIPTISPPKEAPLSLDKIIFSKKKVPAAEYETVAANNLFAEDRSESKPEEVPNIPPEVKPQVDQKMIEFTEKEVEKIALYGVVITESETKALVSNLEVRAPKATNVVNARHPFMRKPVRNQSPTALVPASSGDKVKWVKQGDQIGNFKVEGIKNDSILLSAEGMEFQVLLYEKRGQKNVAALQKQTGPVVVTVGGEAASAPAPAPAKAEQPAQQPELIKAIQEKLKARAGTPPQRAPQK